MGFDWPEIAPVWEKLNEEIAEVHEALRSDDQVAIEDEIGDLLFTAVNLARHVGVDSESAMRRATAKFERRFKKVEQLAQQSEQHLTDMPIEALDKLWERSKNPG